MSTPYARPFSRRRFLGSLTLAGTVGLLGGSSRPVAAEPPPETTSIRLFDPGGGVCTVVPQLIAEALLKAEGFTDVQYVQGDAGLAFTKLIVGDVDLAMRFV